MDTLKKFRIYFFIFVGISLLLTILTNFLMRDDYKEIKYEIKLETLEIAVEECKASHSTGYVKGSVTNNTEELINLKYLEIRIYNKEGIYLGSEYKELKYFNPKEIINFDINYEYLNIDKIEIDLIDEIPEKEKFDLFSGISDETVEFATPVAGFLLLSVGFGAFL